MIVLTIWNNEDRERIWIKEFPFDSEEQSSSRIETLFEWKENDLPTANRIRVDRMLRYTEQTKRNQNGFAYSDSYTQQGEAL